MKIREWIAYIIYEKLAIIFNRNGIVYTAALCELANKND